MIERDQWYTPQQIAQELHVSAETVRRWARSGRVPAVRQFVGRTFKIKGSDILDRLSELEAKEMGH